jgi:hypothetical protein
MKKNRKTGKLSLGKAIISKLNATDLSHLKGGGDTTSCGFATCNNALTCGQSCVDPKACGTSANCPTVGCTGVKTC